MTIKVSRVRKVPQFPHQKGSGLTSLFQLLIGILLWVFMIVLFAIGAWANWFGTDLSFLFSKKKNIFPWWFNWICTIFFFPATLVIILVIELVKALQHHK